MAETKQGAERELAELFLREMKDGYKLDTSIPLLNGLANRLAFLATHLPCEECDGSGQTWRLSIAGAYKDKCSKCDGNITNHNGGSNGIT